VTDLWLASPDPEVFAIGADAVGLTLVGIAPVAGRSSTRQAPEIRISDASIRSPYVRLTRTTDGWVLPPFEPGLMDAQAVEAPYSQVEPETVLSVASMATVCPVAPGAEWPAPPVVLARVRASGGRLTVVDQAATPAIGWDVGFIDGSLDELRVPGL